MPPTLALLSGLVFIGWMFRRDKSWRELPSNALWVPAIWLAMTSSRQMSFWFGQLGIAGGGSSNLEGSPINIVFNTSLFLVAVVVLKRRGFSWVQFAFSNKPLFPMYAFFACSMLWSPFPFPTLKRVIQDFGSVLTALVLLTEKDPAASLRIVFVRVSYVLFPLSVVFMKYFPNIGRSVSEVSGAHMLSGVADHKNSLGQLAMVFCLVLILDLMQTRDSETREGKQPERWVRLVNLGIGLYLLVVSDSATSQLCFLAGLALLYVSKRLAVMKNARIVFMLGVLTIIALLGVQQAIGLSGHVSEALGRGEGMSGRTEIWQAALAKNTDYWFGAGFRSFWESPDGLAVVRELHTNQFRTVHNGYIEVYLDGGVVALCLLGAWVWAAGLKATTKLTKQDPVGRLSVVFWSLLLMYNVSESQFFQSGPLWFGALLVTMANPHHRWGEAISRLKTVRHQRGHVSPMSNRGLPSGLPKRATTHYRGASLRSTRLPQ